MRHGGQVTPTAPPDPASRSTVPRRERLGRELERRAQTRRGHAKRALAAGGAALAALVVSSALSFLGPLLVALVIGVIMANVPRLQRVAVTTSPRIDRLLLRAGVVLLGLKVSLAGLEDLGIRGLLVVVGTVTLTYATTQVTGRRLGLDRKLVTLIAAGFSICGAAAVVAVESSIRAKTKDVALAVALVTVFGSGMIGAVPLLGGLLGLTPRQTAVWAGASIHEVAQVVMAASLVSGAALATATTVKLARVALLVPVQLLSTWICREPSRAAATPLPAFLVWFVVAVALRSTVPLPTALLELASDLTTLLLSAAMFGLGTTLVARQLWPAPWRSVLLAGVATVTAAVSSLALLVVLL